MTDTERLQHARDYLKAHEITQPKADLTATLQWLLTQAERTAAWDEDRQRHVEPINATCATCQHSRQTFRDGWGECTLAEEPDSLAWVHSDEPGCVTLRVDPSFSCSQWCQALDGTAPTQGAAE